jgi:mRNA interferase RelE/StbE
VADTDYVIRITKRASKELKKNVAHQDRDRIIEAIEALAGDPRPHGCLKVRAAPAGTLRIRVGDYRIIYVVPDAERTLIVARIARRYESTYKDL